MTEGGRRTKSDSENVNNMRVKNDDEAAGRDVSGNLNPEQRKQLIELLADYKESSGTYADTAEKAIVAFVDRLLWDKNVTIGALSAKAKRE